MVPCQGLGGEASPNSLQVQGRARQQGQHAAAAVVQPRTPTEKVVQSRAALAVPGIYIRTCVCVGGGGGVECRGEGCMQLPQPYLVLRDTLRPCETYGMRPTRKKEKVGNRNVSSKLYMQ
jgi:hypothetical protein